MQASAEHVEQALDEALKMTFPASDPVAVYVPQLGLMEPRSVNNKVRRD